MKQVKKRLTYDIEPELLKEVDNFIAKQKPMKLSRNNFFSIAVSNYLNEKGSKSKNEKVL